MLLATFDDPKNPQASITADVYDYGQAGAELTQLFTSKGRFTIPLAMKAFEEMIPQTQGNASIKLTTAALKTFIPA